MADPRGLVEVSANGKTYKLWLGMSVLADLQGKHGADVFEKLNPPAGASLNWVPDLGIIVDMFRGALERFHADDLADNPYLPDDIIAENATAFGDVMAAAFPEQKPKSASGNAKGPKRAA
jgi:hypothetical protein